MNQVPPSQMCFSFCRVSLRLTISQDVITYKGRKVYPSEHESILLSHPAVVDAAVIGVPEQKEGHSEYAGGVPCGFVVVVPNATKGGPTIAPQKVLQYANAKLGHPKDLEWEIKIIETIPRSPAGKVLRRELKKMAGLV